MQMLWTTPLAGAVDLVEGLALGAGAVPLLAADRPSPWVQAVRVRTSTPAPSRDIPIRLLI
ncbi:hypothetical protein BKD30_04765 [Tersicoccus phoenicis]|uniref:Uncharacterized protein n=1 Tax=Tersicoccus phoenicis TaxID=554083 RepID=A0A1R1LGP1_9MICC|nr:hypothetical protein BKD30_04765 [Tersicoccus phoenicis]